MKSIALLFLVVSTASARLFTPATEPPQPPRGTFKITQASSNKIEDSFIVHVKKGAKLRPLLQAFELEFPNATIKHKFRRAAHGFSVIGVTAVQIAGFAAESCNGMVSEVLENAKAKITEEWGLDRIDDRSGLDNTYSPEATGAGVDIYVIDVSSCCGGGTSL
jgi:hypothetical protein